MSDSPDAVRADIEKTRAEFGRDVDALADKVTPSKVVHRQTQKMKGAVRGVVERVMGAADDAGDAVAHAGSSVADSVGGAGGRAVAKAQGNPLAVGLMAFAAGLVVAAVIPSSSKEREVAEEVKEKAQPLVYQATSAVREVGEDLKEPAKEAVATVKDEAADAVAHVKDEATDAAAHVKDSADDARGNVNGA